MCHQLRIAQSGSGWICRDHSAVVTRGDEVSTTCQPDLADLGDVHGIVICKECKADNRRQLHSNGGMAADAMA